MTDRENLFFLLRFKPERREERKRRKIGQRSKCFDSPFSLYLNYIFNEYGRGENNRLENSSKGIEREKNKKKG
jgi:hypothetical protein